MPVVPRPTIVIPGGSGFLSRALSAFLYDRGYGITILSRRATPAGGFPPQTTWLTWIDLLAPPREPAGARRSRR